MRLSVASEPALVIFFGGPTFLDWRHAMDEFIARLNIEHFQQLLRDCADAEERRTLIRLLAEEEAKLANLLADEKSKKTNG